MYISLCFSRNPLRSQQTQHSFSWHGKPIRCTEHAGRFKALQSVKRSFSAVLVFHPRLSKPCSFPVWSLCIPVLNAIHSDIPHSVLYATSFVASKKEGHSSYHHFLNLYIIINYIYMIIMWSMFKHDTWWFYAVIICVYRCSILLSCPNFT